MLKREFGKLLRIDERSVFPVAAGRMGLYLFLKAAGLDSMDEVIVPAYTCVVVTNAIKYTGARVVYADLAQGAVNPGLDEIENVISNRTKIIIVPHNYGIVFEEIPLLKQRYPHILVVEDCAHTLASRYNDGHRIGTKGDAAFFSFEFSKPVTSGLGGVLIVQNTRYIGKTAVIYASLGNLSNMSLCKQWITLLAHLITSYPGLAFLKGASMRFLKITGLLGTTSPGELEGEIPKSYPSRLSGWQSRLVALQLRSYPSLEKHLKILENQYREGLKNIPGLQLFDPSDAVLLRFPVLLPFPRTSEHGVKLMKAVKAQGFLPGEWFNQVVHPHGSLQYCYTQGTCQLGESYAERMMNLPMGIHIKPSGERILKLRKAFSHCLNDFFAKE